MSSYSTHVYTGIDEAKFLKRNRSLHWNRLALSSLIVATAIAIIACEVVPYRHYKATSQWASSGLTLWPLDFDLRPTIATLACGCVIALLNSVYILVAVLPSPHARIRLLNKCAFASTLTGFTTALIGLLFVIYRPGSTYPSGFTENETLQSWTCKWQPASNHAIAPINFSRDCHDTRAGFALLCMVLGMEILMGVSAVAGSYLQRNMSRQRGELFYMEK